MRPVYMYLRSAANARAGVSGSVISVVPGWDSFMPPYSKALPNWYHCHYSDQAALVRTVNLHRYIKQWEQQTYTDTSSSENSKHTQTHQAAPVRTANIHRHMAEQCFCPTHHTVIQQEPADFINTRNSQAMEQGRGTLPVLRRFITYAPLLVNASSSSWSSCLCCLQMSVSEKEKGTLQGWARHILG